MHAAQLHLVVNHISLIGIPIAMTLLAIGYFLKSELLKRVAVLFCFVLSFAVLPAYATGDSAEDLLETYPGISEAFIEKHEEAAEFALVLALMTGAAAGLSIVIWNFSFRKWVLAGVFLMSVVTTVSLGYVAHLGGQIRHIELRDPNIGVNPPEAE